MLNNIKRFFYFLFSIRKTAEPTTSEKLEEYKNLILQLEEDGCTTHCKVKVKLTELNWRHIACGGCSYVYLTPCKQFVLRVGSIRDTAYPLQAYQAICDSNKPFYYNVYALMLGLKSKHTYTFMEPLDK